MQEDKQASNQTVSLSTAGMRALVAQLQALYLRTPVKLFRPSRFDYLVYVRELADKHHQIKSKPYSFRTHLTPGMIFSVARTNGWRFLPDQVLPPLVANSATGVILYATYLTTLDILSPGRGDYSPIDTWKAGFLAGAAQSLAAAPVDAIYTRLSTAELISGEHTNLWVYGIRKLREIGLVGVFAGYGFSFAKESVGFAFYFLTFELIKTRGYRATRRVLAAFGRAKDSFRRLFNLPSPDPAMSLRAEQRQAKFLKSTFVLLAGASAAFVLLAVQYPITKVQKIHLARLEARDIYSARTETRAVYYRAYLDTYHEVVRMKRKAQTPWLQLAYKGFVRNALTSIPATSVGLLVFEIMRTRLAEE